MRERVYGVENGDVLLSLLLSYYYHHCHCRLLRFLAYTSAASDAPQMWPVHNLYLESLVTEALRRESPDTIIFRKSESEQEQMQEDMEAPYPRICTRERATTTEG